MLCYIGSQVANPNWCFCTYRFIFIDEVFLWKEAKKKKNNTEFLLKSSI